MEYPTNNVFEIGDKVTINNEDDRLYTVYDIYGDTEVSLGLYDYPDIEQDYTIETNKLTLEVSL